MGSVSEDVEGIVMIQQEHIQTAQDFLAKSDGYFTEGDVLQGSEKLWGAAAHAVMALAQKRGWKYGNHYSSVQAVERIAEEQDDRALRSEFGVAEKFHANFYHDFMEEFQLEVDRPVVRGFVERILAILDELPGQSINGLAE